MRDQPQGRSRSDPPQTGDQGEDKIEKIMGPMVDVAATGKFTVGGTAGTVGDSSGSTAEGWIAVEDNTRGEKCNAK